MLNSDKVQVDKNNKRRPGPSESCSRFMTLENMKFLNIGRTETAEAATSTLNAINFGTISNAEYRQLNVI